MCWISSGFEIFCSIFIFNSFIRWIYIAHMVIFIEENNVLI